MSKSEEKVETHGRRPFTTFYLTGRIRFICNAINRKTAAKASFSELKLWRRYLRGYFSIFASRR